MSAPPKDVAPSELWRRLSERPRPSRAFKMPCQDGFDFDVVFWVLTESELHFCRANAQKVAKEILGGEQRAGELGYEDIYQNELVVQLVCIACRSAENTIFPAFPSPKQARQKLTTDEFGVLATAYSAFRRECGPMLSEMTPADMEQWIKVLREGASRVPLARLSPEAKSDLILHLIQQSSTATGSAGSPQDVSSSEQASASKELIDETERAASEDT